MLKRNLARQNHFGSTSDASDWRSCVLLHALLQSTLQQLRSSSKPRHLSQCSRSILRDFSCSASHFDGAMAPKRVGLCKLWAGHGLIEIYVSHLHSIRLYHSPSILREIFGELFSVQNSEVRIWRMDEKAWGNSVWQRFSIQLIHVLRRYEKMAGQDAPVWAQKPRRWAGWPCWCHSNMNLVFIYKYCNIHIYIHTRVCVCSSRNNLIYIIYVFLFMYSLKYI